MYEYSSSNKLKLNVQKTEIISNEEYETPAVTTQQGTVPISNKKHSVRYLGIKLNISLDWTDQVKQVKSKMMGGLMQMYKLKGQAPPHVLRSIYDALVNSHLQYGLAIWKPGINKQSVNQLEKIQKLAIKCITNTKGQMHYTNMRQQLKILTIQDLATISILKFMFNIMQSLDRHNPVAKNFLLVETRTRQRTTILPIAQTHLLQTHSKVARDFSTHLPLQYTKKTILKHIATEMASKYTKKCRKTKCYICSNQTKTKSNQHRPKMD